MIPSPMTLHHLLWTTWINCNAYGSMQPQHQMASSLARSVARLTALWRPWSDPSGVTMAPSVRSRYANCTASGEAVVGSMVSAAVGSSSGGALVASPWQLSMLTLTCSAFRWSLLARRFGERCRHQISVMIEMIRTHSMMIAATVTPASPSDVDVLSFWPSPTESTASPWSGGGGEGGRVGGLIGGTAGTSEGGEDGEGGRDGDVTGCIG